MIGKTLGSYRIVHELGAGGMGKVYAAEHQTIGRRAAIKVLLSRYSKDKAVTERFFTEATAATRIHHPGIIDIFDFGWTDDGSAYIMMELLEGESLADRIKRFGRLSDEESLRLSRQMANALGAAHAAGIVHRDLKPDNVFLVPDAEVMGGERVKLLDFGIAKVTDELGNSVSKTSTGMILGSPLYMSPEQCMGNKEVDQRADIYALGCVMFHMTCGRPPFTGTGSGKIIAQHIYEKPKTPSFYQPAVRPEVEGIILRALQKEPEDRFASMAEFEQALVQAGAVSFTGTGPRVAISTPHGNHVLPPTVEIVTDRGSGSISAHLPGTLPPGSAQARGAASAQHPVGVPGEYHGSPTTLGSVASQITGASSRRGRGRMWLAALVIVVFTGGGVAAWQLGKTSEPGADTSVAVTAADPDASPGDPAADPQRPDSDTDKGKGKEPAVQAADASVTHQVTAAGDASTSSTDPSGQKSSDTAKTPPTTPVVPDKPVEKVQFRIVTTRPAHAVVRDSDSNVLGETPLTIDVPKDGKEKTFVVSHDGFRDETLVLVADQSHKKKLKLRKARGGSSSSSSSSGSNTSNSGNNTAPPPDTGDDDDDDDDGKGNEDFGKTTDPFDN